MSLSFFEYFQHKKKNNFSFQFIYEIFQVFKSSICYSQCTTTKTSNYWNIRIFIIHTNHFNFNTIFWCNIADLWRYVKFYYIIWLILQLYMLTNENNRRVWSSIWFKMTENEKIRNITRGFYKILNKIIDFLLIWVRDCS